jgi:UrcA family protein
VGGRLQKETMMTAIYALLAITALAAPAVSNAATEPQSMAVHFGDLDLASQEGQRILASRVKRAAEAMCKAEVLEQLPQHIRSKRECMREAQSRAVQAAAIRTAALAARSTIP